MAFNMNTRMTDSGSNTKKTKYPYSVDPALALAQTTKPATTTTPYTQPATQIKAQQPTSTPVTEPYVPLDPGTTTAPATTTPAIGDMVGSMYDDLLTSKTAQITSATESAATRLAKALTDSLLAKDEALNSLTGAYQQAKNRAAGQSDIGKYNYAQTAAAQGIEGNAAMQNELYSNVGLQNALGG